MDVSDASYYKHKNNKNKSSQMGHTKKKNLKKHQLSKTSTKNG